MRKPLDLGPSSSSRRLALALVCAFAACLNPRPEEYPSDTASPGNEAADAPPGGDTSRQGADNAGPTSSLEPDDAPEAQEPSVPSAPPDLLVPEITDAGAGDAGGGDAGALDAGALDAGAAATSE